MKLLLLPPYGPQSLQSVPLEHRPVPRESSHSPSLSQVQLLVHVPLLSAPQSVQSVPSLQRPVPRESSHSPSRSKTQVSVHWPELPPPPTATQLAVTVAGGPDLPSPVTSC